jgi:PadR family transcriptional regulator, regulatory protein PadR
MVLTYKVVPGTLRYMVAKQDALLAQMRRGTLEYCVLALLAEEERYGFDLVRGLAEMDGMVTSEGTIYPLLSRLRRDGLVETTWRESSSGPPRRYYRLTNGGRAALDGFKGEWGRFRDAVDHFVDRTARS